MALNTSVNISRTRLDDVFVQTNSVTYDGELIKNISYCQITMTEEDCIELTIALSFIHLYTDYEDANHNVTRFSDGKIIKQYTNE